MQALAGLLPCLGEEFCLDIARDHGCANPFEKNEDDLISLMFLVPLHGFHQNLDGNGADGRQISNAADRLHDPLAGGFIEEPCQPGKMGFDQHSPGDGLSMGELLIFRGHLQSVAKGVSKIENSPQILLFLILGGDLRLDGTTSADHFLQDIGVLILNFFQMSLEKLKEFRIADKAIFNDLV